MTALKRKVRADDALKIFNIFRIVKVQRARIVHIGIERLQRQHGAEWKGLAGESRVCGLFVLQVWKQRGPIILRGGANKKHTWHSSNALFQKFELRNKVQFNARGGKWAPETRFSSLKRESAQRDSGSC